MDYNSSRLTYGLYNYMYLLILYLLIIRTPLYKLATLSYLLMHKII